MGRKRVQLLVLLAFMVAVTNCVDTSTPVTSNTENTISSTSTIEPASATTTDPAIPDDPVTLPPPDPSVTKFNYYVRDPETGVACILANMSIFIAASYVAKGGDLKTTALYVPPTAEVRGTCRGAGPTIAWIWWEGPKVVGTMNRIAFTFGSTGNVSFLQDVTYVLYMDNKTFPEAVSNGGIFADTLQNVYKFIATKNDGLYKCASDTTLDSVLINITVSNVSLITYNTEKSVAMKTEENCVPESEPATIPLPPPDPSVTKFNYYVRDPETGVACILANMSISIIKSYVSRNSGVRNATLTVPLTATVRGHCSDFRVPTMELIWSEDPKLEGTQNGVALIFGSTDTKFYLQDIILELYRDGKNFPDAIQEGDRFRIELQGINQFSASKNGGLHRCDSKITVGATMEIEITISNVALIAFNTKESVATRTEEKCVSGANVAQWSGYLLLTAKILIFLKLGDQGI